jgi:hypothetical protein
MPIQNSLLSAQCHQLLFVRIVAAYRCGMSDEKPEAAIDSQSSIPENQQAVPERKALPTTQRGRPLSAPLGTGFGFFMPIPSKMSKGVTRYLMSGADALKVENIVKLFEQLKGRKATPERIANVERQLGTPDV